MAKDSSFDVVSQVDRQEVDNALHQAKKELAQRFDFKGTGADIEWTGDLSIDIKANAEQRVEAAHEVFKEKCIKRNVPLKSLKASEVKPTGGGGFKITVDVNQGIPDERAREIVKTIKNTKLKVQAAIQGDQLRVSGSKKDDLQAVMQLLREGDFGVPLQFTNYR
ncbi:MAG: YajQ family cyclic di-GMP-binding protein [Actinomycetota bacterium]|nr:YajQ family cyclic di-GMP-binding protein [Actinomycetota bacterium]